MSAMIDAIVVVLPEPVAPQISTSPRDSRASTSMGIGNRSDASVGTSVGSARMAAAARSRSR